MTDLLQAGDRIVLIHAGDHIPDCLGPTYEVVAADTYPDGIRLTLATQGRDHG